VGKELRYGGHDLLRDKLLERSLVLSSPIEPGGESAAVRKKTCFKDTPNRGGPVLPGSAEKKERDTGGPRRERESDESPNLAAVTKERGDK